VRGGPIERLRRDGCCTFMFGKVIHPDSRFRTIWNVMLAVFICYCGIAVPLEIAFETDMVESMCGTGEQKLLRADCPSFQWWFWLNFIIDMWFITDIVVNFRTGYVVEGHFVNGDRDAACHYLKGSFFMDCLGSFPLNLMLMAITPDNPYGDVIEGEGGGTDVGRINRMLRLIRMAKLAKLARMFKLAKYLDGAEAIINPGMLSVIKLILISLLCCHWFGCLWWMISDLEMQAEMGLDNPWYTGENNWRPPHWLKNEPDMATKYLHAFFWGAGMVTSMVPRDIEPVTALEAVITTFTMFFGLMLNAFVISSLTTALASMNSKKELAGAQLAAIKSFLLIKHVPPDIRSRILEYYEYHFTSSSGLAEMTMFNNMPPALKCQLDLSVSRRLTARCNLFREVTNASLLVLIAEMQPAVFVPAQVIVVESTPLLSIYFINKGMVMLSKDNVSGTSLKDNENWGVDDYLDSCMEGDPDTAVNGNSARAVTYCDVMSLSTERMSEELSTDASFERFIAAEVQKKADKQASVLARLKATMAGPKKKSVCTSSPLGLRALRSTSPGSGQKSPSDSSRRSGDEGGLDERTSKVGSMFAAKMKAKAAARAAAAAEAVAGAVAGSDNGDAEAPPPGMRTFCSTAPPLASSSSSGGGSSPQLPVPGEVFEPSGGVGGSGGNKQRRSSAIQCIPSATLLEDAPVAVRATVPSPDGLCGSESYKYKA